MTGQSDWFCTEQISASIRRIWEPHVHRFFQANFYYVTGRDADLMIDFGMGLAPLKPFLDIDAQKPLIALATHVHVDHIGSFHEFEHRLGHNAEAKGFETMADDATLAHLFRHQQDGVAQKPSPAFEQAQYLIHPAPLTRSLDEGDVVDLGGGQSYRVLHLPGHSPGSIGLLDEHSGIFFSGDAVYEGGLVDDLPGCDRADYCRTMERLGNLDVSIAYGGHGAPMSSSRMQDIANAYLQQVLQQ